MEINSRALRAAEKIKLIIFDVDGVLTDGGIYIGANGELFKPFYCRDGLAITLAHKQGLQTAIITGRKSAQVEFRAQELKKLTGLQDEEIAYIGDDLIDLPIMLQVGLPMAVADAVAEVRSRALVVSGFAGGRGAVRELLEFIFKAQGRWEQIMADFITPQDNTNLAQ